MNGFLELRQTGRTQRMLDEVARLVSLIEFPAWPSAADYSSREALLHAIDEHMEELRCWSVRWKAVVVETKS